MNKPYAIIDNENGWLVNSVIWDGNLETWQPPEGTHTTPVEEVDFATLPLNPDKDILS